MSDTPAKLTDDQAKALVAGPLGVEMQKFPLRFCKPVLFGDPPSRRRPSVLRSGTVTLLEKDGMYFAVTCWHVLEAYRAMCSKGRNTFFAIANCHFDPLPQISAEDSAVDVSVIRLTPKQAADMLDQRTGIGQTFYSLGLLPSKAVQVGNYVAFGGFPGDFRRVEQVDELSFGTYSSGSARVTDRHSDYFTCQFEREFWIRHVWANEPEPSSLGGMSGGPAFVIRHSPLGIISYEFCGVIYRMHEASESLFIREAGAIPL